MTQTEVSINICTLCMLLPECTPCCSALWVKTPAHECTYLSASESGKHVPNQKHFKDLKFEEMIPLLWKGWDKIHIILKEKGPNFNKIYEYNKKELDIIRENNNIK